MITERQSIRGAAFPFRIENGGVAQSSGAQKLSQDLKHLLLTRIGERAMRRNLGGGLQSVLHEPTGAALIGLVRHELNRAVRRFAPEIEIISQVDVRVADERLHVAFSYRAAPTGDAERLELTVD